MNKEITLILSPIKRTEKPACAMEDHFQIHQGNMVTISWEEFANAIGDGQSFSHGIFANKRNAENFAGTELLVLDIDNKEVEQPLTIQGALERLSELGLDCNLIYTTFSDNIPKGEKDAGILMTATRYRIIFCLSDSICELSELNRLLDSFYVLFPEADSVSGVQFWYGGKNIPYTNFDYVLDLELFQSSFAIHQTSHLTSEKRRNEKLKELAAIQNYRMVEGDLKNDVLKNANTFNIYKGVGKKQTSKAIRNFNWAFACSQFELLDSFLNCKKKIYHNELHYLYLGMSKIEGGAKMWKAAVKNNPDISDKKLIDIAYYLEKRQEVQRYNIFEARISKYAPNDKAATRYDFLTNISNKVGGKIELIDKDTYTIPEPDATSALNYFFKEAKSDLGNVKYVFKCATGLGKTEEILKTINLAECVIAFPTHKLKDEFSARMNQKAIQHFVIPELPPLPSCIKQDYDMLSGIGAFEDAAALLRQISMGDIKSKYSVSDQDLRQIKDELAAYFKKIEDCRDTTFPVLTTHKKLFTTEFPNHSTYIIDEDIFPSLFEVKSTTGKDLRILISKLKEKNYPEYGKDLKNLLQFENDLGTKYFNTVTESGVIRSMFSSDSLEKFAAIAIKNGLPMEGSLIGLFSSDYFFVNPKDEINDPDGEVEIFYLKKNVLPEDGKIIVLSATAEKDIYSQIFGSMEWLELIQVEQKGTLTQVSDHSFSRSWMYKKEHKEIVEFVRDFAGGRPVITYKKQKSRFRNSANICLESSEGIDELRGKDIVVVGTPHLKIGYYALLATALGIQFTKDDLKLEMVRCEHQNQCFDFYTFKHEGLRKVQFYKIESLLLQACGRARALRENVNVHLFSNFPLLGFEKITLDELKRRANPEPMSSIRPQSFSSGSQAA